MGTGIHSRLLRAGPVRALRAVQPTDSKEPGHCLRIPGKEKKQGRAVGVYEGERG